MKYYAPMGERHARPPRPPMITFNEAAELFGITPGKLQADFRYSTTPVPASVRHQSTGRTTTWYVVKEMKAWRAAFEAEQRAKLSQ